MLVDWTTSSTLRHGASDNRLSITKIGHYFHFMINGQEVTRRRITGIHGGSAGAIAIAPVDASFDNFHLTELNSHGLDQVDTNIDRTGSYVQEYFLDGPGGFRETEELTLGWGKLIFRGDLDDTMHYRIWEGGYAPGGTDPSPKDSNFFKNYLISSTIEWNGGRDNYGYGLITESGIRHNEVNDSLHFIITANGWYRISHFLNDSEQVLTDWTFSSLINQQGDNLLEIDKDDTQFQFFINEETVEFHTLPAATGGAVGIIASSLVDITYQDYTIRRKGPGFWPNADAGKTQYVMPMSSVTLDGSSSTSTTDPFSSQWFQLAGPPVELSSDTSINPVFSMPHQAKVGEPLVFQLVVKDDSGRYNSDFCYVHIRCHGPKGDIDGSQDVTLKDIILSLQMLINKSPQSIPSDFVAACADVNNDGKIGIAEAIYALGETANFN